jgi:hypothetical protein
MKWVSVRVRIRVRFSVRVMVMAMVRVKIRLRVKIRVWARVTVMVTARPRLRISTHAGITRLLWKHIVMVTVRPRLLMATAQGSRDCYGHTCASRTVCIQLSGYPDDDPLFPNHVLCSMVLLLRMRVSSKHGTAAWTTISQPRCFCFIPCYETLQVGRSTLPTAVDFCNGATTPGT